MDDRVIDGPLTTIPLGITASPKSVAEKGLIDDLLDAMRPFVSEETGEISSSFRKERRFHYPMEAMREMIINAVSHRDWTRNEEIEIVNYANRLEITSPGSLPNGMTVEKMIAGQRSARNPLIVQVCVIAVM